MPRRVGTCKDEQSEMTVEPNNGREVRAESFASVADCYERARPGYPLAAIEWTLGSFGRVLDLGAGTGKLTRQLVALGYETVAVEPLAEMLAELRLAVPEAEAYGGRAEAIPLTDKSQDAVVAAQAFHWFDAPRALAEIARVLRSGGRLGLLWNIARPEADLTSQLSPLAGGLPSKPPDIAEPISDSNSFGALEEKTFLHEQLLSREELLMLASSWSYFASMSAPERADRLTAVGALFDQVASDGSISFPYITYAYRTDRR